MLKIPQQYYQLKIQSEKTDYNGVDLNKIKIKIPVPVIGEQSVNLTYAFKNNFIIISSDIAVQKLLDTENNKNLSISKSKEYSETLKNSRFFFEWRFGDFINYLRELLPIADSAYKLFKNPEGFYSPEIEKILRQISCIDKITGFTRSLDSGEYSEYRIIIQNPNIKSTKY